MAAVAAGAIFAGVIICHDLAHNHEIFVSKRRRIAQVVDSEDAVAYARETNLARAGYDHALRRWALRRAPRVFGGGRRGEEYGLCREGQVEGARGWCYGGMRSARVHGTIRPRPRPVQDKEKHRCTSLRLPVCRR